MKMKKGLCFALSIAMVILTFAACGKKDADTETTTQTNMDGNAYVNVTDADGKEITNADGENVTSMISYDEKSKIDSSTTVAANGSTTVTTTTGSLNSLVSGDSSESFDIAGKKEDLLEEGTTVAKKTTLRDDIIGKVTNNKKFTLSTSIVSGGNKIPTTISMNGNDICAQMTYSSIPIRVLIQNNKMYMVLPSLKMYTELSESEFGSIGNFSSITDDQTYIATTTVKDGSTTYTCEEYKNASGATVKYYFSGNEWKRWELIDGDDITVFEVDAFSGTVDTNAFSLSGYVKQDLSGLTGGVTTTTKKK